MMVKLVNEVSCTAGIRRDDGRW